MLTNYEIAYQCLLEYLTARTKTGAIMCAIAFNYYRLGGV